MEEPCAIIFSSGRKLPMIGCETIGYILERYASAESRNNFGKQSCLQCISCGTGLFEE